MPKAANERQSIVLFNIMKNYLAKWIDGSFNKEFSTDEFFFTYYFFYLHLFGTNHYHTAQKNSDIDLISFIEVSNFVDLLPASFIQTKNLRLLASGIICNSLVNCENTFGVNTKQLLQIATSLLEQSLYDLFRNEDSVALMQIDAKSEEIISNSKILSETFLLSFEGYFLLL